LPNTFCSEQEYYGTVVVHFISKYQINTKSIAFLMWRKGEEEEEEEFFNHYQNNLKRHAHTPSGVAGADLKS